MRHTHCTVHVANHKKSVFIRKRKVFDSPSAPTRAADHKLFTEFDLDM